MLLILGAGYTVSYLLPKLQLPQSEVALTCRTPEKLASFKGDYLKIKFDIESDPAALNDFLNERGDEITHILDSVPYGTEELNMPDFLSTYKANLPKLKKLVYISATSVYGIDDGRLVDESTECQPVTDVGIKRLHIEGKYREHFGDKFCVVRPAAIYGGTRNYVPRMIKEGRYPLIAGERYSNRIQVEDLAEICRLALFEKSDSIVNATDNNPLFYRDILKIWCEKLNLPVPEAKMSVASETMRTNANIQSEVLKAWNFAYKYPKFTLDAYEGEVFGA